MIKKFDLESWQGKFVLSDKRYPAMVSGWGTGKTLCGIFKAISLSETYPNNLGVIFRKEYTDLRDSTIKDFELYTGLKVSSERNIKLGNGSEILFRHLEEINNIQNMNLGWFLLEQAEELDSDQEFSMLRGRLRRQDVQHCGMVIANTKGHNWIYNNWKVGNLEDFELIEATTHDNKENLPKVYLDDLEKLKIARSKIYNRFVMNSWEESDTTDIIISPSFVRQACRRKIPLNYPLKRIIGVDIARYGDDKTVMYALENGKVIGKSEHEKKNTMETVGRIILFAKDFKIEDFAVDEIGVGGGVVDRLRELGKTVKAINSAGKEDDRYYNIRAEMYDYASKMFDEGVIQLDPQDTDLIEQLSWAKYKEVKSNGVFLVEAKEDIKKRYGRSPDNADAFIMALWAEKFMDGISREKDKYVYNGWKNGVYYPPTPQQAMNERANELIPS